MLSYLSTNSDYITFVNSSLVSNLDLVERFNIDEQFVNAFRKMVALDVDSIHLILTPLYSNTGRPAVFQIEILRSLILMVHFGFTSIKLWSKKLKIEPHLAFLIGCMPRNTPASSNHYDFIFRLFPDEACALFEKNHFSKPNSKPKKGEKLNNNLSLSSVSDLISFIQLPSFAFDDIDFTIQSLFHHLAVVPSFNRNLINDSPTISGDGSSLHIHANSYGNKVCMCDTSCDCLRRYSDKDADIGWDSDLETFYFGHTLYTISFYNPSLKIDLPLFVTLDKASTHDSKLSVSALEYFIRVNNFLFHPKHYCLDSASDSYDIHHFIIEKDIIPIIDINKRNLGNNLYDPYLGISSNGRPICQANLKMKPHGMDTKRYRHKFLCPKATRDKKTIVCDCKDKCSPSSYGRVVYIKSDTDIKLFGSIPYRNDKWIEVYKNRTSCERMNNRFLNDYNLHFTRMRGKSRLSFFSVMIGINVHMDAWIKSIS